MSVSYDELFRLSNPNDVTRLLRARAAQADIDLDGDVDRFNDTVGRQFTYTQTASDTTTPPTCPSSGFILKPHSNRQEGA